MRLRTGATVWLGSTSIMSKESATEFATLWTIQIKSISEKPQIPAHVSLGSCGILQAVLAKSAAMVSMILVLRV